MDLSRFHTLTPDPSYIRPPIHPLTHPSNAPSNDPAAYHVGTYAALRDSSRPQGPQRRNAFGHHSDRGTAPAASSKASAIFNLRFYPQVADRIISFCEPSTIRTLRGVSRALRKRMNLGLPRHIIVKHWLFIHTPGSATPLLKFTHAAGDVFGVGQIKVLTQDADKVTFETDTTTRKRFPVPSTTLPALRNMAQWVEDSLCRIEVADLHFIDGQLPRMFHYDHHDHVDYHHEVPKVINPAIQPRLLLQTARTWAYPGGTVETWEFWCPTPLVVDRIVIFFWPPPGEELRSFDGLNDPDTAHGLSSSEGSDSEESVSCPFADEFGIWANESDWLSNRIVANRITLTFDLGRDLRFLPRSHMDVWTDIFKTSTPLKRYVVFVKSGDASAQIASPQRLCTLQTFLVNILWCSWMGGRHLNKLETVIVGYENIPPGVFPLPMDLKPRNEPKVLRDAGFPLKKVMGASSFEKAVASMRGNSAPWGKITLRTVAEHEAAEGTTARLETDDEYYLPEEA